jgi:glycosyltransferase involved in cell wall biosynthesis
MGAAAGRRIADHFSLEAMTRELERLYRRLLREEH